MLRNNYSYFFQLLILFLSFFPQGKIWAKGAVTQINYHTEAADSLTYVANSETYTWQGNNMIIDSFVYNGNTYNYEFEADNVTIRRVDNALVSGERCTLFSQGESQASTTILPSYPRLEGTDNCDMEAVVGGNIINRGVLDVFNNGGGGRTFSANNIERIDFVFSGGVAAPQDAAELASAGVVATEKSGNNDFVVAAVLSLDASGNPASYSKPVLVHHQSYASDPTRYAYGATNVGYDMSFVSNEMAPPHAYPYIQNTSTPYEGMGMVFIDLEAFELTAGQVWYGFSYFSADVGNDATPNALGQIDWGAGIDPVDYTTFPTDTDHSYAYGDADMYGGIGGYFVKDGLSNISGAVYRDENSDNVKQADEDGISNITITLYGDTNNNGKIDGSDTVYPSIETDSLGAYLLAGLPNGNYVLRIDDADSDLPSGYQLNGDADIAVVINSADQQIDYAFQPSLSNPLTCSGDLYQSSNQDTENTDEMGLYKIDRTTNPYGLTLIGSIGNQTYNALAYRTQDNFLYALYYNELLKMGSDGTPQSLGTVTGLANDRYYSGTTDDSGYYYAAILDHTADNKIYKIDVTTTPPQVVETITMERSLYFWDFVYIDGYFYALETVDGASDHLIKIGLDGTIQQIGDDSKKLTDYDFGSVFTDSTGSFYAIDDSGKGFFRIDLETVSVTHLSDATPSRLNDGASCATGTILVDAYDYGDAPDSYKTTDAVGGARHAIVNGGPMLGNAIDHDDDGQPSNTADSDDTQGIDDEDGISFASGFTTGSNSTIQVTTSQPNHAVVYLNAWIDFNGDGDFEDTGEQIADDQVIADTDSQATLVFQTPVDAQAGQTYARFRVSSVAGLSVNGAASDGEVEDYAITIQGIAETCAVGVAGAGDYALGWWHNGSSGTAAYQDAYWNDYPNTNTATPANDSNVIASAADEAYGSGITGTIDNYEMFVNGADTSGLADAIAANDYVQYQFTTTNFATDKYVSRFVNTVGQEHSPQAYPYEFSILISEFSDFSSYVIAKQDIVREDWNNSTPTWSGDSSFKIPEVLPDQFALIKPNTTYYVRVYFYNDTSTYAQGVEFDDFNIGMADCVTLEGNISGTVYTDNNGNDSYDSGTESGLSSISVTLYNQADDSSVATTSTGADGTYTFMNVDASLTYRIEANEADSDLPDGSVIGTTNPLTNVIVSANATTANQDIGFDQTSDAAQCPVGESLVPIADKFGWAVLSVSSSDEGTGAEIIDDNIGTRWLSDVDGSLPQQVIVDLGQARDVGGLWYYPKQGDAFGAITDYRVEVSTDNINFSTAAIGSLAIKDSMPALIEFAEQSIRYIKLVATGTVGGSYVDITELSPLTCAETVEAQPITIANCSSFDYFHTGHDHENGGILPLKNFDKEWLIANIPQGTTDSVSALDEVQAWSYTAMSGDATGYQAGSAASNWHNGFSGIADWITNNEDAAHVETGSIDRLYRKDFSLDMADQFLTYLLSNLELNFFTDNTVWDIVVNGTSLKSLPDYTAVLPSSGADDPYNYLGYVESNGVSLAILSSLLLDGNNSLVVHVKSDPQYQSLFAETTFNMACDGVDLSDAPSSYGRALHGLVDASLYIGTTAPDADTSILDGLQADGDDNDNIDDEGGANIAEVTQDEAVTLTIDVSGNGYLQAWLDFNSDGVFGDDEQVAIDVQDGQVDDVDGTNNNAISIAFNVPLTATTGLSYLRLRWSSETGIAASGVAIDGEVEDYAVQINKKVNDPIGCESIDGFADTTPKSIMLTAANLGPYSEVWTSAEASLMGGARTVSLGDGNAESENAQVQIDGGQFDTINTDTSGTPVSLCYDANGAGLSKNLSAIDRLRIMYSENQHEQASRPVVPITVELFDGTRTVSMTQDMVENAYNALGQEQGWANLTFDLSAFSGIDFFNVTDVQHICVNIDKQVGHDYTFADIQLENSTCSTSYDLRLDHRLADGQANTVAAGESVTFTLEVFNEGEGTASNIELVDYIPASLTLNDSNWTENEGQATLNSPIASLIPGESTTVDIRFIANSELRTTGTTRFSGDVVIDEGECKNEAEIMSFAERIDEDSVPDNINGNDIAEDDFDPASINVQGLCQGQYDFGDAPDTEEGSSAGNYQTQLSDNGARHLASNLLYIGNCVDTDDGDLTNAMADADDTSASNNQTFGSCASANDDEDGLVAVPLLSDNDTSPSLNVTVYNNSGNQATLACWADYNGDGAFDNATERGSVAVASTGVSQTVNVVLPDVPSTAAYDTGGTSYLRCRIASSNGADNAYGSAADGEVEDYRLSIEGHCTVEATISNVQCDNQGTAEESDDTWSFDAYVSASGVGGSTDWQLSGDMSTSGSYVVTETLSAGLVANADSLDLLFSDSLDSSCKTQEQVQAPDYCSGGCSLFVSTGIPVINQQSTATAADDVLEVEITVTGVTPSTAQWVALREANGSYVNLATVSGNDTVTLQVNIADIMSVDPNGFTLRVKQSDYSDCYIDLFVSMPNTSHLQINKTVIGAAAPDNWAFTVSTANCTLPAGLTNPDSVSGEGGAALFEGLAVYADDGSFCLYNIVENEQAGYTFDGDVSDDMSNVSLQVDETTTLDITNSESLFVVVRDATVVEGDSGTRSLEFLLEISEVSTVSSAPVRNCSGTKNFNESFTDASSTISNWDAINIGSHACDWSIESNELFQRAFDYQDCHGFLTPPEDPDVYHSTSNDYSLDVEVDSNFSNSIFNFYDNSGVGIVFGFKNLDNYYLARWHRYGYAHALIHYYDYRHLQILKVVDGQLEMLADQKFDLPEEFDMEVVVNAEGIALLVDDEQKLLVTTEQPVLHRFGLYSNSNDDGITYDDLDVETNCSDIPSEPTSVNDVDVTYEIVDESASQAEGDYALATGTARIPAGESYINVPVDVYGDTRIEGDETFTIRLTEIVNGQLINVEARGTIIDDDFPVLSVNDVSKTEGNSGTTAFEVSFSLNHPALEGGLSFDYTTADDTATTANNDYQAASGTVTIAEGETSATITIDANGDTVVENDETFNLLLSNENNVTLVDVGATLTIVNDDVASTPDAVVSDVSVLEGDSGTTELTVTVSLSDHAPVGGVTVDYTTSDSTATTANNDYQGTSGTLTIAEGQIQGTIVIDVVGDTSVEADETLSLSLSNPNGVVITDSEATLTIINDDDDNNVTNCAQVILVDQGDRLMPNDASSCVTIPRNEPTALISIADNSVVEGDSGTVDLVFTVSLNTPAPAGGVSVDYVSSAGTATQGVDYQATSGTLVITEGNTTGTIAINVNGDTLLESDETMILSLSNPVNGHVSDAEAIGTIIDNDASIFSCTNTYIFSSDSTTSVTDAFSVDLATGTYTLLADDFHGTNINAIGYNTTDNRLWGYDRGGSDAVVRIDADFNVSSFNIADLPAGGDWSMGDVSSAGILHLFKPNDSIIYRVDVNINSATYLQRLSDINLTKNDLEAEDFAFHPSDDNLYIPNQGDGHLYKIDPNTGTVTDLGSMGITDSPLSFNTVFFANDGTFYVQSDDADKLYSIDLSNPSSPSPAATYFVPLSGKTFADAARCFNAPPIEAAVPDIVITDSNVIEGNSGTSSLTFTVNLSAAAPVGGVSIDYETSDLVATVADNDYQAATGTLVIPEGSSSGTIEVFVNGDTKVEDNETFLLSLLNPSNAALDVSQAVGTIVNDDTVASCSQSVNLLNSVTASAVGSGSTGVPSIASLTIPEGDNRVVMVLATFEREHCDSEYCSDDVFATELGDNFAIPGTHSDDFQISARFSGAGGVMDQKNPMLFPEGDLRFFNQYGYIDTGSNNSQYAFISREAAFIAIYESDITSLLGGQSSGDIAIELPDINIPKDTADEAILMAYVFENVEQSTAGVVRSGVEGGAANYLTDPYGTSGNYYIPVYSLDSGQSPDHAQDGLLVFAVNGVGGSSLSGQAFNTMTGFSPLDTVITTNANGHYTDLNEADGYSAATQFANGVRNSFTIQSAAPAGLAVNGGAVAAFTLSCIVDGTQTPQPIAEYRFDECSWDGSNNEVIDSSGNILNGASKSGAYSYAAGKFYRAGSFDGVNDRIEVNNDDKLKITRDMTLATWVYADSIASDQSLIYKDHEKEFELYLRSDNQLVLRHGDGSDIESITLASPVVSENTWTHIAVVRDSASNAVKWFINGQLESTQTYSMNVGNSVSKLRIGRRNSGEAFDGVMDEVKLFNQVLSDSDIEQMYNNESAGYNFDGTLRAAPYCVAELEARSSAVGEIEAAEDGSVTLSTVWVNEGVAEEPYVEITAEVPEGTVYVPMEAATYVSDDGVYCEVDGQSEGECYYEPPSEDYPQGRVVWTGVIVSEDDVPNEVRGVIRSEVVEEADSNLEKIQQSYDNEVLLSFRVLPTGSTASISAQAYSDWYFDGVGDTTVDFRQHASDTDSSSLEPSSLDIEIDPEAYAEPIQPIPTLSEWALIIMSIFMMLFAWRQHYARLRD